MGISESVDLDVSGALQALQALDEEAAKIGLSLQAGIEAAIASVDLAPLQQAIEGFDASPIADALSNALTATDVQLTPSVDASAISGDITTAVDSADTSVVITDVDASAVTDAIEAAAQSADTSTIAVGPGAEQGAAGIKSLLTEGLAGTKALDLLGISGGRVASKLAALDGVSVGAATGIIAMGAALKLSISESLDAEAAQNRLNLVLGVFAGTVETIKVGSLNSSLSELSVTLGTTPAQVQNAISNFGQLGLSAGATGPQIAKTSQQLVAIAASARALNPALGDLGDVVNGVSNAFGTGQERRLAAYGIALNKAQINAEAVTLGLAGTEAEVTNFDRRVAGAQLTVEKFGDTFGANVAKGTDTASAKLGELKASFDELFKTLGETLHIPELLKGLFTGLAGAVTVADHSVKGLNGVLQAVLSAVSGGTMTGGRNVIESFFHSFETGAAGADSALQTAAASIGQSFATITGSALDAQSKEIDALSASASVYLSAAGSRQTLAGAELDYRDAVKASTDAARSKYGVDKAQNDLNAARSSSLEREQSATDALDKAKRDLNKTLADATKLESVLSDAREKAKRDLEDLALAASSLAVKEQEASLAQADAAKRAAIAQRDGLTGTRLGQGIELDLAKANDALKQVQAERERNAKDLADANQKGIEGSDVVVAAQDQITQANDRIKDAQLRVVQSQAAKAKAFTDGDAQIAAAESALATAHAAAAEAQARANLKVEQSQQALVKATLDSVAALGKQATAEGRVIDQKAAILDALNAQVAKFPELKKVVDGLAGSLGDVLLLSVKALKALDDLSKSPALKGDTGSIKLPTRTATQLGLAGATGPGNLPPITVNVYNPVPETAGQSAPKAISAYMDARGKLLQ